MMLFLADEWISSNELERTQTHRVLDNTRCRTQHPIGVCMQSYYLRSRKISHLQLHAPKTFVYYSNKQNEIYLDLDIIVQAWDRR